MTETVDTIVIGAGAVGLAIARRAQLAGAETVVLEAADAIGTGISSRNSEVIHAGIYYPEGSLKARFCVAGRKALYGYCESHGIAHKRTGKLIVATTDNEVEALAGVLERARANGVDDLERLSAKDTRALEPALSCSAAILSPSTGIVDSHSYMLALQGDAEAAGAVIAFNSPMAAARITGAGIEIDVGGVEPATLRCRRLVNSAGLFAVRTASMIEGFPPRHIPKLYLAKGNYFTLSGKRPFDHFIYPVPVPGGLGTHSTVDLAGQTKFGPDVEWLDIQPEDVDFNVDAARADRFYEAIRRYWPEIPEAVLRPGYAGIRPKLAPEGEPAADFVIEGSETHGVDGIVNLFGIESPGLTSSLAIADYVAGLLALGPGGETTVS